MPAPVDDRRRRRVGLMVGGKSRLDKDVGLQVRGRGVPLDNVGQSRIRDHEGRGRIKPFILPEEAIACAQGFELVANDRLEGLADVCSRRVLLRQSADEQIDLIDSAVGGFQCLRLKRDQRSID